VSHPHGSGQILIRIDWAEHGAAWFDHANFSENDRRKIGRHNAASPFKLRLG
jgi:predicted TIM-barrel fold metal-dependent hydrolase